MISWWLIIALSVVTFFNRYIFFSEKIKFMPSKRVTHLLGFSAQAVMTALWVPIVIHYDKQKGLMIADYHYLIPTAIVLILSFFRINILLVLAIGMGTFYALRWLA